MGSVRSNPCFQALKEVCDEYGLAFEVEDGGKHPKLIVHAGEHPLRMTFPSTPSDVRSPINSAAQLRRKIEAATAPNREAHMDQKTVTVLGQNLGVIIYKGEPVVTFDMVDAIHKREPSTARQTFHRNKSRFVEGVDFFVCDTYEASHVLQRPAPNGARLITRRGYLKLVKPLTDDRAWKVQDEMIDRYFVVEEITKAVSDGEVTLPESVWRRIGGVVKSVTHKSTEDLRAGVELVLDEVSRLSRELDRVKSTPVVPAFDLSGTVTSRDIMDMAGIPRDGRVRGTTGGIITRAMKDYCLGHGFCAQRAPEALDPDRRWRFPRQAALDWLTGPTMGGEIIRNHITRANARRAAKGQRQFTLVPTI